MIHYKEARCQRNDPALQGHHFAVHTSNLCIHYNYFTMLSNQLSVHGIINCGTLKPIIVKWTTVCVLLTERKLTVLFLAFFLLLSINKYDKKESRVKGFGITTKITRNKSRGKKLDF